VSAPAQTRPASVATAAARVRAIDWLRGLVMVLMTVDHASAYYNLGSSHSGDTARGWIPGTALAAAGQYYTRWMTHLCAPAFVLLAGAALALSTEKRRNTPGQTAFIVKRGLVIAALDPLWMSLGFTGWHAIVLQVLYAIGLSLVCMAFLRKLPSSLLLAIALGLQAGGELTARLHWLPPGARQLLQLTFTGGFVGTVAGRPLMAMYPFVPWLSIMIFGFLLGRWLVATRGVPGPRRALPLIGLGLALLALFTLVRGLDGYGNWELHRDSLALTQWLHVSKYPPAIAFTTLELGLALVLLGAFFAVDDGRARPLLAPLGTLGATAFFFYLLHVHLLAGVALLFGIAKAGLGRTYLAAALAIAILYPACARYRRYKGSHPDGWTRYI
jgi:uncharacterized membrane protein